VGHSGEMGSLNEGVEKAGIRKRVSTKRFCLS